MGEPNGRIETVDAFRLLAIIAVIAIHSTPFAGTDDPTYERLAWIIIQFTRFAVPFFFVISGYFWGEKIRSGADPVSVSLDMGRKIGLILLVWSIIYLLPYNITFAFIYGPKAPFQLSRLNIIHLLENPLTLLMEGGREHLWFLVALLFALFINLPFIRNKRFKSLIAVSVLLYLVGLLAKSYADTPLGFSLPGQFNTRNGPFFGTVLFTTGYFLSGAKATPKWLIYGAVIAASGFVMHFTEVFILHQRYGASPFPDYVIGTYFTGVGAAMASLSNAPLLRIKMLRRLGQVTLGVYAMHGVFIDLLKPIDKMIDSPWWEIGYVFLVLYFSVSFTRLLARNKYAAKVL